MLKEQPLTKEENSTHRHNFAELRKLLNDPRSDPETTTDLWIQAIESAELRDNRMELRLLLNFLRFASFAKPLKLRGYQAYYQGVLHERELDLTKAEKYFTESCDLIRGHNGYELLEALCKRGLSNALIRRNENEKAKNLLLEALVVMRQANARLAEGNALKFLAVCYYRLGEIAKSLETAQAGVAIARELNNLVMEAYNYNTIGLCNITNSKLVTAREALEHALNLYKATGNVRNLSPTYLNLGWIHLIANDFGKAVETTKLALFIAMQARNKSVMAVSYLNLAATYNKQYDTARALEAASRSLQLYEELGNKTMAVSIQVHQAISYAISEEEGQARKCINKIETALAQLQEKNNTFLAEIYTDLTEATLRVASSPEDYEKAYGYKNKAIKLFEDLHSTYSICILLENEATILFSKPPQQRPNNLILPTLQKWWEMMQKFPEMDMGNHISTLLIFAELLSEHYHKAQSFEIYNLAFTLIHKKHKTFDKTILAAHYLKASKNTTPDQAIPLVEQALVWLSLQNLNPAQLRNITREIKMLRKQQRASIILRLRKAICPILKIREMASIASYGS